jgi:hypothetical protein
MAVKLNFVSAEVLGTGKFWGRKFWGSFGDGLEQPLWGSFGEVLGTGSFGAVPNYPQLPPTKVRVLKVVAVVLPIRSLVDELRVARIAGSPQFEPAGQNRF